MSRQRNELTTGSQPSDLLVPDRLTAEGVVGIPQLTINSSFDMHAICMSPSRTVFNVAPLSAVVGVRKRTSDGQKKFVIQKSNKEVSTSDSSGTLHAN